VRLLDTAEAQQKKKQMPPKASASPAVRLAARAASELDIRGCETLEAESIVENYIDSAVMAKLGTVTIIHGKGTGALRNAVHQELKRNKYIKTFRLGVYGEGEDGVTIAEFR
jgi:DNA mismatch repair protein MutS2